MTRLEEVQYLRTEPNGRHYNCAQSLLVPFGPQFGLDKEQADKLGSFFGSGMLHGSACGALSATLMLLGLAGYDSQTARQIIQDFRQRHQDTHCTALLTLWRRYWPRKANNPGNAKTGSPAGLPVLTVL